jgi:hypothetical protein
LRSVRRDFNFRFDVRGIILTAPPDPAAGQTAGPGWKESDCQRNSDKMMINVGTNLDVGGRDGPVNVDAVKLNHK